MMNENDSKKAKPSRIKTRVKDPKLYSDEWIMGDDEIEERNMLNVEEKLSSDKFNHDIVQEMSGKDFSVAWVQRNGFSTPLIFHSTDGLGLKVPGPSFTINDVRLGVGSRRMLDVMDVGTQKNTGMTMKQWQQYYESSPDQRKQLLNVISLEFSHTKLERHVQAPAVVRQIDWVDCVWPRHLKSLQTESTNAIDDMMYPKVQKYCLMSVQGCYTDFHIDFGGTSVWYHVVKGGKVFWLIPPTDVNIDRYEKWALSGKQSDVFFGDTVDVCGRVHLKPGDTFFIPTGWIHAVYTPSDSLVFGGNFLHSFGVEKQLRISKVEDATRVEQKYRYPFFTEMLWYVLERYVSCLLGRSHLVVPDGERRAALDPPLPPPSHHQHLTPYELHGLKAIVLYLHALSTSRKNVPELVGDPAALIQDIRALVQQHRFDSPAAACTGLSVLRYSTNPQAVKERLRSLLTSGAAPADDAESESSSTATVSPQKRPRPASSSPGTASPRPAGAQHTPLSLARRPLTKPKKGDRRRRIRCRECEGCTRGDCMECGCCKDMLKYGGTGSIKQSCKMRVCQRPQLPYTALCSFCGLSGWGRPLSPVAGKRTKFDSPSMLYECRSCFKISHIQCTLQQKLTETEGRVQVDLPNCWTCPVCVDVGAPPVALEPPPPPPPGVKRKPGRPPGRPRKPRPELPPGVPASQLLNSTAFQWRPPAVALAADGLGSQSSAADPWPLRSPEGLGNPSPIGPSQSSEGLENWRSSGVLAAEHRTPQSSVGFGNAFSPIEHQPSQSSMGLGNQVSADVSASLPHVKPPVDEPSCSVQPANLATTDSPVQPTEGASGSGSPAPPTLEPMEPLSAPLPMDLTDEPQQPELTPQRPDLTPEGSTPPSLESSAALPPLDKTDVGGAPLPCTYTSLTGDGADIATYIQSRSRRQLKRPLFPVRPAPITVAWPALPVYDRRALVAVFAHLSVSDLLVCQQVCRAWCYAALDRRLWPRLSSEGQPLTVHKLRYLMRRQPITLQLSWSPVTRAQLGWLLARLPGTRRLEAAGLSFSALAALRSAGCPPLTALDLSHAEGITDARLGHLLSRPCDLRPGSTNPQSRLRHLRELSLADAAITDGACVLLATELQQLTRLDVSGCVRLTDEGAARLGELPALRRVDVSGCHRLTALCLPALARSGALRQVTAASGPRISRAEAARFTQQHGVMVTI